MGVWAQSILEGLVVRVFKILFIFVSLAIFSEANSFKLEGIIASANNADKTIIVDSVYGDKVTIKVLPNTEIEMDNCGVFGIDKYGTFRDLRPGTFVEVKLYFQNFSGDRATPIAREIEIECYKNRAY